MAGKRQRGARKRGAPKELELNVPSHALGVLVQMVPKMPGREGGGATGGGFVQVSPVPQMLAKLGRGQSKWLVSLSPRDVVQ